MSDTATLFKLHFADWEWLLREDGESEAGIEEIRQQIREDWSKEAKRAWWMQFVAEKSAERQALIAIGKMVTQRVKENANAA